VRETLVEVLGEKRILVHNLLIRGIQVPPSILDPIQKASIAVQQDLTNKERQNTARRQAELNTQEALIEQRRQEVMQETEKLVAETAAGKEKEVARIHAQSELEAGRIHQETATVRADITRRLGDAAAKVITLVDGERARGLLLQAEAVGDPLALAWMAFADNLNPGLSLQVIHAGPGTLWTDLKGTALGTLGGARLLGAPAAAPAEAVVP
jgi:multidrug efflux pump subunit AcrA (membrane-fusion protein)